MSVPAGYMVSEVGVIPKDWDVATINACCDVLTGFPFASAKFIQSGFRLIRGSNVKRDEIDWSDDIAQYWPDTTKGLARYLLREGDIVIAMDGALVGRSFAEIPQRILPALLVQRVARLRAKGCNQRYVSFWIRSDKFSRHCDDLKTNTAIPHISPADIKSFQVALPPTDAEQAAIAEALSDVDAAIAAQEAVIAKKRALKTATMQALLSGTRRLPGFSGRWEVKALGQCLKVRHGKSQASVETINGNYPILATGGEIGRAKDYLHPGPSVLIGRKGTIDRPQYSEGPFWSIDTLFYTEIDASADAKYLFYRFQMIDWRTYNEASGVPSLSSTTIEAIEVEMPKRDEQTAIASTITEFDLDLEQNAAKLTKLRHLKTGMMQQLLTGKIRLI